MSTNKKETLRSKPFSQQAARASWMAPVISIGVLIFVCSQVSIAQVISEIVILLLCITGLVLGVVSLFGVRRYGVKNILVPAVLGVAANLLLLSIFAVNFYVAFAEAKKAQPASSKSGISGRYSHSLFIPEEKEEAAMGTMEIAQVGDKIQGTDFMAAPDGSGPAAGTVSGAVNGAEILLNVDYETEGGQRTFTIKYELINKGDTLEGVLYMIPPGASSQEKPDYKKFASIPVIFFKID